jgi:metal-responsive CopG/Arc/MetJ family transcriptional regulator
MSNMTTVRLPDDLVAAMQKLQERDGMPVSEQIRRALREFLTQKRVYKPKREKR